MPLHLGQRPATSGKEPQRQSSPYAGESVRSRYSCTINGGRVQLDNQFIAYHTHISNKGLANVGWRNRSFKMRRKSARVFVYTISTEVSVVSINRERIIFGLGWLWHILLRRSITLHELRCKMIWPKAKDTKRIGAEKRIDLNLSRRVHILS